MKNAMGQVGLAFPGEGVMMRVFSPALVSSVCPGPETELFLLLFFQCPEPAGWTCSAKIIRL